MKYFYNIRKRSDEEKQFVYKRHNFLYILAIILVPLWGVILRSANTDFNDPYPQRLLSAFCALVALFLSKRIKSFFTRSWLIFLYLQILTIHVFWVTGLNNNHYAYIGGLYLAYFGSNLILDEYKQSVYYAILCLVYLSLFNLNIENSYMPNYALVLMMISGVLVNSLFIFDRHHLVVKLRNLNSKILMQAKELDEQRAINFQSSKLASLGEMAGGVAHEINNPLAIINGNISRVERYLEKEDFLKDRAVRSIDVIKETVSRIHGITQSLLLISNHKTIAEVSSFDIKALFSEIKNFVSEKYKSNDISFAIDCPESIIINFNKASMLQVIITLLNNAEESLISSNSPNKEITLKSFKDKDNEVIIQVIDNGPGIKEEVKEKIFDPFFTTKNIGDGAGLGLSTSKKIVEQQAGSLSFASFAEDTIFSIKIKNADLPKRKVSA